MSREDWRHAKELISILEEASQEVPEELRQMAARFERRQAEGPRRGGGGGFRGGGRGGGRSGRGFRDYWARFCATHQSIPARRIALSFPASLLDLQ